MNFINSWALFMLPWLKQVEQWIAGPPRTLGVLDTRDAHMRSLTGDTNLRYKNFSEDANFRLDTSAMSQTDKTFFSRTGLAAVNQGRPANLHTSSITDFRNHATGHSVNKRGVHKVQYGRFDGPTADEYEYADKYCVGDVQPVNRIIAPGLHSQDIRNEEKIALLYAFV